MSSDELREKKMRKLQAQMQKRQLEEEAKRKLEAQKKQLMRKILTPDARSRLANLRVAKPQLVESIELQLIQLARSGKVNLPIPDEQLRKLLRQLQNRRKSISIKRK